MLCRRTGGKFSTPWRSEASLLLGHGSSRAAPFIFLCYAERGKCRTARQQATKWWQKWGQGCNLRCGRGKVEPIAQQLSLRQRHKEGAAHLGSSGFWPRSSCDLSGCAKAADVCSSTIFVIAFHDLEVVLLVLNERPERGLKRLLGAACAIHWLSNA